jgi:hypothetical protein
MERPRHTVAGVSLPDIDPQRREALKAIAKGASDLSADTQRRKVLTALQTVGSLSTFEASRYLDVYDVRPRVWELRQQGHAILTTWTSVPTESGRVHRIGVYIMKKGAA